MNIMELGAIGELVGGVAVIASLIYVGIQVRQNTSAIRADSAQGFADSINGAILKVAGGGESARCLRLAFENSEAMTDDEKITADHIAIASFQSYDSGLLQAELGSLDEATRAMIHRRIRRFLEFDYYSDWWTQNHWKFSEPLTLFVEQECGLRRSSPTARTST